jgi:flagellar hook-basal body complex protein FliE
MIGLIPGIVSSVAASAGAAAVDNVIRSGSAQSVDSASFTQMLDQMTSGVVDSLRSSEAASIAGVQGKASAQQVVDQIMAAERTLQAAIAVRDKAVSAYQEISRMTI